MVALGRFDYGRLRDYNGCRILARPTLLAKRMKENKATQNVASGESRHIGEPGSP